MDVLKKFVAVISFLLMCICIKNVCYANPGSKPFVIIVVNNAPKDLDIVFEDKYIFGNKAKIGTETQFSFFTDILERNETYKIVVTSQEKSKEYILNDLDYKNVYTLDINNETLSSGIEPTRYVRLVIVYIVLTLILEGIIFFAFGFRNKKSWIFFVFINVITQLVLHYWTDSLNLFNEWLLSYDGLIYGLVSGEVLVFIIEIIAFSLLIKEKTFSKIFQYVLTANLFSLVLGWFVLVKIPL